MVVKEEAEEQFKEEFIEHDQDCDCGESGGGLKSGQ